MDTEQHLKQPPVVKVVGDKRLTLIPIFHHPFNGWEISKVEDV